MRYIANIFSLLFTLLLILIPGSAAPEGSPYHYGPQPGEISSILEREKDIENRKCIIAIINHIDNIYGNLFEKLENGRPVTIYFDPAHGKLKDGRWESETTGRLSCTNLPEEYYSIQISRKIYEKFKDNELIEISSTEDFLNVIKNESDVYYNIPFKTTIELAEKTGAFLIISEHLNNISCLRKASGRINLSGIHITLDEAGNKYLSDINGVHHGFLTLYNKYDITGLSEMIASNLKGNLVAEGLTPNNWDFGTVADDRFSYFYDFPISVIFESGFISNPNEENILRDPEYQEIIAEAQYHAIIKSFNDVFHIDISDDDAEKNGVNENAITMMKLSRISFYYIKKGCAENAVSTINKIVKLNNESEYKYSVSPYLDIKNTLLQYEKYFARGFYYLKAKKWWTSRINFLRAWRKVKNTPLFSALREKCEKTLIKHFKRVKELENDGSELARKIPVPSVIKRASRNTPVIFPVHEGQSVENAVKKALSPDPRSEEILVKSFKEACNWKKKKIYRYSKKKKRTIYYYKWIKEKIDFNPGIYIVKLNNKLKVIKARKVWQVPLDYRYYQNEQYMNNSFIAHTEKEKAL